MTNGEETKYAGKVVKFVSEEWGVFDAFIVGIDYDIGITLVQDSNRKVHLSCLHGPGDPIWRERKQELNIIAHDAIFDKYCEMIASGEVFERELFAVMKEHDMFLTDAASPKTCPFGR